MELRTSRLLLREFCAGDRAAVLAFAGDAEVTRYTDWEPICLHDTIAVLTEVVQDSRSLPRSRFGLAVVDREDERLIGSIELRITSESHARGEMGYVLGSAWWGRGYASEAAAALLRFGFDELGLHRISATCEPDTAASARVLTKIGFHREGHLRDHLYLIGRWRDRLIYAAVCTDR